MTTHCGNLHPHDPHPWTARTGSPTAATHHCTGHKGWAHDGTIPDPTRCDECFETTEAGSALCAKCAWNRYDDQLDEWWSNNPLPEADAS